MKKNKFLICAFIAASVAGCSSTGNPSRAYVNFPEPPPNAMAKCESLQLIPNNAKTQDMTNVVASNYESYNECSRRNNSWVDWYQTQRENFNTKKLYR